MLQTLKTQRKRQSRELISLWSLFDDVVVYEEDPSGTSKGIASIKTKWPEAWQAYETAKNPDSIVEGVRMVLKMFDDVSERIGLQRLPSVGQRFDPAVHDAIQQLVKGMRRALGFDRVVFAMLI